MSGPRIPTKNYRIQKSLILSVLLLGLTIALNLTVFRDPETGKVILHYGQTGAPPIEETVKITLAAIFTISMVSLSKMEWSFNDVAFIIWLLLWAIFLGISEVLDGKTPWNIADHMAYSSLFLIIYFHQRTTDRRRNRYVVFLAFMSAWTMHFIHNVLVHFFKDTSNEIYVAIAFWILSPIIIYSMVLRIFFDRWPFWRVVRPVL